MKRGNKQFLDLDGFEVIEKSVSAFGNTAHVVVSKNLEGKSVCILAGKNVKITGKKAEFNLFETDVFTAKVKTFGTGAHVLVPRERIGETIKLIVGKRNE